MNRTSLIYILVLSVVGLSIAGILHLGSTLPAPAGAVEKIATKVPEAAQNASVIAAMATTIVAHFSEPLSRLFLQLLIIIAASRITGQIFASCGQPWDW